MSRRIKLLEQLLQTETFGQEDKDQKDKLRIVSELILCDMVELALNGVQKFGAGSLFINLIDPNREAVFMSGTDIEVDLTFAESLEDEETVKMLRQVLEQVDENDWENNVVFTFITHDGTRTYSVEAGGSAESFRAIAAEFS